jgi:hypothetical protein
MIAGDIEEVNLSMSIDNPSRWNLFRENSLSGISRNRAGDDPWQQKTHPRLRIGRRWVS